MDTCLRVQAVLGLLGLYSQQPSPLPGQVVVSLCLPEKACGSTPGQWMQFQFQEHKDRRVLPWGMGEMDGPSLCPCSSLHLDYFTPYCAPRKLPLPDLNSNRIFLSLTEIFPAPPIRSSFHFSHFTLFLFFRALILACYYYTCIHMFCCLMSVSYTKQERTHVWIFSPLAHSAWHKVCAKGT